MARYAEKTTVAPEKSRAEIEQTLIRYGADKFTYGYEAARIYVAFQMDKRVVKIILPMPTREDEEYQVTWQQKEAACQRKFDQAIRQRWRALFIVVKAKLESVESGIETFDEAFMPHIVIPSGENTGMTVGQAMIPDLARAIEGGEPPKLITM